MPDVPIDAALAARLMATQFPQWAHLPVRPVPVDGWDHRSFRLGDDMTLRLPSAVGHTSQGEKEYRWLPVLAPHLPLPGARAAGPGHRRDRDLGGGGGRAVAGAAGVVPRRRRLRESPHLRAQVNIRQLVMTSRCGAAALRVTLGS